MPFCPTCGKFVEDGVETCSCGTKFIVSPEDKIKQVYGEEEKLVKKYREYETKSKDAYDAEDFESSLKYANMAIDLDLGSDASMKYIRGKSLYNLNRFYDSLHCFKDYIDEYKDSFYRFSNISGAYQWKARSQWQLGDGFGAIKSYYNAIDFVDKKNGSNDYKNEIRFQIREEKRMVINSSKGKGISNPRLGSMDYETYDILEKLDEDKDLTMQNLYDAIDEVDGYEYKSVIRKGDKIYVVFENEDSTIEKLFDGSNSFVD